MRATKMLIVLGAAAGVTGATAAVAAAGAGTSTTTPAARLQVSRPGGAGPAAADHAAVSYLTAHHPGTGAARVLATEPDTDRGLAVYDVRVLAPDGTAYEVHVSRATDAVLWANRSEEQVTARAAARLSERAGEEASRHTEDDSGPAGSTSDR